MEASIFFRCMPILRYTRIKANWLSSTESIRIWLIFQLHQRAELGSSEANHLQKLITRTPPLIRPADLYGNAAAPWGEIMPALHHW